MHPSHPYLQVSSNGFVNLRVDNPSNIIMHHSAPLVPTLAINDVNAVVNNPASTTTTTITNPPTSATTSAATSLTCANEKNGIYDYLTLPYHPDLQNEVENYYGPIQVLNAGPTKGRTQPIILGHNLL